jgi:hypothetical protein
MNTYRLFFHLGTERHLASVTAASYSEARERLRVTYPEASNIELANDININLLTN